MSPTKCQRYKVRGLLYLIHAILDHSSKKTVKKVLTEYASIFLVVTYFSLLFHQWAIHFQQFFWSYKAEKQKKNR